MAQLAVIQAGMVALIFAAVAAVPTMGVCWLLRHLRVNEEVVAWLGSGVVLIAGVAGFVVGLLMFQEEHGV